MTSKEKSAHLNSSRIQSLIGYLTSANIGPRRHCFRLITAGRVSINHQVVQKASTSISSTDIISVDGNEISFVDRKIYLKINKPKGVISTTSDNLGRPTILDLLPPEFKESRLYPIGRLDTNTTGLLLITNDGTLFNHLAHPRFRVEKEYLVELTGRLSDSQKNALEKGILINGEKTASAKIKLLHNQSGIHYSVTIHEGKKRQIRLMFMAAGLNAISIKRVRIHKLILGNLGLGKVAKLTKDELKSLLEI